MRVQFASDLHLNSWAGSTQYDIPFEKLLDPVAKTLVLCGDIGHPDSILLRTFLKWCSKRWELIFWIPGHHEMTDVWHLKIKTYDENLNHLRLVASEFPNVHILHRDAFVTDDGFLFLGCPLWARLTAMSEEMSKDPIYRDITKHFEEDMLWLRDQIKRSEKPIIIATHYPPTYTLFSAQMVNKPQSVPFALESEFLLRPPVYAWICGYLHKSVTIQRPWADTEGNSGQTLIVCNARGYPDDALTGYRTEAVLRLENPAFQNFNKKI
jgi:hypothetical protein